MRIDPNHSICTPHARILSELFDFHLLLPLIRILFLVSTCILTASSLSKAFLGFMQNNTMLTAQQIVVLSAAELEKLLEIGGLPHLRCNPSFGLSHLDYKVVLSQCLRELWLAACRVSSPISLSSLSFALQSQLSAPKLRFCDKVLDERFAACFLQKGVLDVVGEASSGKTQFCLQLLLSCITPSLHGGLGKGAFYIHTEGEFPIKRWDQLRSFRLRSLPNDVALLEDQLVIQRVPSIESMDAILDRIRPILRAKGCAVLVIDSIANLVCDLPTDQKQSLLYRWICNLQETSDDIGIPIITTNHVIDFIDDANFTSHVGSLASPKSSLGVAKRHSSFVTSERRVLPALGLRWSELVNARISLSRTSQLYDGPVQLFRPLAVAYTSSSSIGEEQEEQFDLPHPKRRKLLETCYSNPNSNSNTIMNMNTISSSYSSSPQAWEDAKVVVRHMQVLFSPSSCSDEMHVDFFVDGSGLHGIP